LHRQHAFGQAIATLEQYARESDDGAWLAYRFLGHTYLAVDQLDQAIAALETALRLLPPEAAQERDTIQGRLDRTRKRLAQQAESS
jgi:cytochrome c-type biogenesis protein CcmH/NrfG